MDYPPVISQYNIVVEKCPLIDDIYLSKIMFVHSNVSLLGQSH